MRLIVRSQSGDLLDVDCATSVTMPGVCGTFQIMGDHCHFMSSLCRGGVSYVSNGSKNDLELPDGGVVEVLNNDITVLV